MRRKSSRSMRAVRPSAAPEFGLGAPPVVIHDVLTSQGAAPTDYVVGIDLGTTTSCIATMRDGAPVVVPVRGYGTTPSVVAVDLRGQRLTGHAAKRQAVTNPSNTLFAMKRLIGRKWESDEVKRTRMACPVPLTEGPQSDVRVQLAGTTYSLPELSAMLLLELKLGAEQELGKKVTRAVVTVPAYFNDNQRQATKDAGTIAGLEVLRMINEPTAAAIAYGYGRSVDKTVVVYDLGGGTFDISIVRVKSTGDFDVLGTGGDTFLGGEDFDRAIIDFLAVEFKVAHGFDLRTERVAVQRLKEAAERAKTELSAQASAEIRLPFIYTPPGGAGEALGIERVLTRADFDEITKDLVARTIEHCKRALAAARLSLAQVDDVLLVGGSTRMPSIQDVVTRFFGKKPSQAVHPDEAVALGAAVHASYLAGEAKQRVTLHDVTPHALGIRMAGNKFRTLIPANSRVPAKSSMVATTTRDDQTKVRFIVLQGQSEKADENELLGEFALEGLPPQKAMQLPISVEFAIDADGIVSVRARNQETNLEQQLTVAASSGLTQEEIVEMATGAKSFAEEQASRDEVRKAVQQVEKASADLSKIIATAMKRFKEGDYRREAIDKAQEAVERAKELMVAGIPADIDECSAELVRRQSALKTMLSSL